MGGSEVHPPGEAPTTPDDLASWLATHLGVHTPARGLLEGHDAPLAYLAHAFFEDGRSGDPARTPEPLDSLVWANRGGGKTFLAAVATALDLVFKPGVQVRILAGSLEQAQRMHAHLAMLFERPGLREIVHGRITTRRVRLTNGSCAEVLSSSQASVRGTRVQKIRCDEVELFDPRVWDAAQLATRSGTCGGVLVPGRIEAFSTMHIPHGLMSRLVGESAGGARRMFKWGVVDVLERCGEEHACHAAIADAQGAATRECPLWPECRGRAKERAGSGHLSVRDAIAMKRRVSLPQWESEMLCLRPRRADCVYPEFDPTIHVIDDAAAVPGASDPHRAGEAAEPDVVVGMDFGFRNPTAILWGHLHERRDDVRVLVIERERIASSMVLAEHIEAIRAGPSPRWIGVDPAGRQVNGQTGVSNVRVLRDAGFDVRSRPLGLGAGLQLVRARLSPADGVAPTLLIRRSCTGLIRALATYHYDPTRPDSLTPVKDDADHAADALRYMVVALDHAHRSATSEY